jgi:hypothetical protein
MAEDTKDTKLPKDISSPDQSQKPMSDKGIAAIRGDMYEYKADEEKDLIGDLEKFQNRPKPPWAQEGKVQEQTQKQIEAARQRLDQNATESIKQLKIQDEKWNECINLLAAKGAEKYETLKVSKSFQLPPDDGKTDSDLPVYRYYDEPGSKNKKYFTPEFLATPEERQEKLALPPGNKGLNVYKTTIPRGTEVLRGPAAPKFGHKGGAEQIYVPEGL